MSPSSVLKGPRPMLVHLNPALPTPARRLRIMSDDSATLVAPAEDSYYAILIGQRPT